MQIQISWLLQANWSGSLHCLQRQGIPGFSRTRIKKQPHKKAKFRPKKVTNKVFKILGHLLYDLIWSYVVQLRFTYPLLIALIDKYRDGSNQYIKNQWTTIERLSLQPHNGEKKSKKRPQYMISWRNKKKIYIYTFSWNSVLSRAIWWVKKNNKKTKQKKNDKMNEEKDNVLSPVCSDFIPCHVE